MNKKKYNNFQEFLARLQKRIHIFLSVPVPAFIFLIIRLDNGRIRPRINDHLIALLIRNSFAIISIIILIVSVLIFVWMTHRMARGKNLRSRLDGYYKASLIRDIFLETILVANLTGLALTGEKFYAGLSGIILIVFLLGYPNTHRIINALKLDPKDSDIILSKGVID